MLNLFHFSSFFLALLTIVSCNNYNSHSAVKDSLIEKDKLIKIPPALNISVYYPESNDCTQTIKHNYYHLSYNEILEQPNWVVYKLTKQMLLNTSVNRSNNFKKDNSIPSGSSTKKDYAGSGYDRGHLVPAADMKFSKEAMSETFLLSNVSPQVPKFNRNIWLKLERKVREWALQNDSLIIVVGPVNDSCIDWIGPDSVCVPHQYFKIILDISPPSYKGIAFLMNNENLHGSIFNYSTTIDSIEAITGYDFFTNIELINMDSIESTKNDTLWK